MADKSEARKAALPQEEISMAMLKPADPLVLDFVEWIARGPRLYSEVVDTWRTSCPRLTIWEDAADSAYVVREAVAGVGTIVTVTDAGEQLLRANGRTS
jgi:hypothetical protein